MSNELATTAAPSAQTQKLIVRDDSQVSHVLDTARFEQTYRFASAMSRASLIPEHLKGSSPEAAIGNCLLVVNQSLRWGLDPFAVAACTYVIKGKLGFEGKLVASVVDTKSPMGRLRHVFNSKQGDDFAIVVYATKATVSPDQRKKLVTLAETNDRTLLSDLEAEEIFAVRLEVRQAKTDNGMWTKDPEQKLVYSGSARWARRYQPELMLGVVTEEDSDRERQNSFDAIPRAITGTTLAPESNETPAAPTEVIPPPKAGKASTRGSKSQPQAPAADLQPQAEPDPAPMAKKEEASDPAMSQADKLRHMLGQTEFDEPLLVNMAIRLNLCETTAKTIADIPEKRIADIIADWPEASKMMADLKAKAAK